MNGIKLLVFILDRGRGKKLLRLSRAEGVLLSLILQGRGTASSEVLEMLGIGDPHKDVVLLTVEDTRAPEALRRLAEEMGLSSPGAGVAFSIPFSALASQFRSYELLAGTAPAAEKKPGRQSVESKAARKLKKGS